jgi:hypothetical protein
MAGGVPIDYHPQPEGEHNTRWRPERKDAFEKFVADHPRGPHPARLTWQAANGRHNRVHLPVIDRFGPAPGEARGLPDVKDRPQAGGPRFARSPGGSRGSGGLRKHGDRPRASVTRFPLLLSPDAFDFSRPVVANGREVLHARVTRTLDTLLEWPRGTTTAQCCMLRR